ncbi:MAG: PCMD domain-containing protein, partial [Bacteroidaceae bacterium]|nr:PCMD domain-containing protein [Bacteroidaceae bacterium]
NVGKNLPAAAPAKGQPDICSIYIALLSDIIEVNNTDVSLLPNLLTDSRVIAYGALPDNQCVATGDSWKEVNIPLEYRDINKKPSYLLVVFSASKYGDYFHGAKGSTLYLDDFSLEYGDEPSVN